MKVKQIDDEIKYFEEKIRMLKVVRKMIISKCEHVWGTDGMHSNEYCKKCFMPKPDIETLYQVSRIIENEK